MNKHTPGPWMVDKYSRIITPTREVLLVSGVALPSGNHPRIEEAEANARLIAAAPELLKACKRAKLLLEPELVQEPDRTIFWELVSAVARAEGRL